MIERWFSASLALCLLAMWGLLVGAQPLPMAALQATGIQAPQPPMTFFVTSTGIDDGANLGGLSGADAHCQMLATAVGRGNDTWHAYLSTQGRGAVNARDRIGSGPWHNANGILVARNVEDLHRDDNNLGKSLSLTETSAVVPGFGDTPNRHDVLTGSRPDGTAYPNDDVDRTCGNYTNNGEGSVQLGHTDKPRGQGGNNHSWNSAHGSRDCSQEGLVAIGGAGLFYCFALAD